MSALASRKENERRSKLSLEEQYDLALQDEQELEQLHKDEQDTSDIFFISDLTDKLAYCQNNRSYNKDERNFCQYMSYDNTCETCIVYHFLDEFINVESHSAS